MGVDVDLAGEHGVTSLMQASSSGHLMIVSLLIKHGADVSARDKYGGTALVYTSWKGHAYKSTEVEI